MWLMTKFGFYSIVLRSGDTYQVRSRERADLENLIAAVPLPGTEIVETPTADYRFRVFVSHDTLMAIMAILADNIDYSNFKAEIASTPDQAHKPYHEVWQVMADALGAYGEPGTAAASTVVWLKGFTKQAETEEGDQ